MVGDVYSDGVAVSDAVWDAVTLPDVLVDGVPLGDSDRVRVVVPDTDVDREPDVDGLGGRVRVCDGSAVTVLLTVVDSVRDCVDVSVDDRDCEWVTVAERVVVWVVLPVLLGDACLVWLPVCDAGEAVRLVENEPLLVDDGLRVCDGVAVGVPLLVRVDVSVAVGVSLSESVPLGDADSDAVSVLDADWLPSIGTGTSS